MYIHKLKIGNVELDNNIILAPMAGITDLPFRTICEKYNPGLVYTEMVSSKAIFHNDSKTKKLLKVDKEKRPIAVQIFGSDIESMEYATKYVNEIADIIDINMGCPAPKVVKNGDGSKLLTNLELAKQIMEVVVKAARVPVTIKIRKGWNNTNIVATEIAKIAEKTGIAAITVHGRTREEYYSGKCDLDIIKKVKETVKIPVIGNGDITNAKQAQKMFEYTGVDGIMIGRGTLGNPWIFRTIINSLENNDSNLQYTPAKEERLNTILEHLKLEMQEKGELIGIIEMRKHISWYTKGLEESSKFRVKINQIEDKYELIDCLTEYFNNI